MGGGTAPRYGTSAISPNVLVTGANTKSDGTGTAIGTDMFLLFSAGANDSFLEFIRIMPVASVQGTATAATVIRAYISSQSSGATTNANTATIDEISIPSVTADGASASVVPYDMPIGLLIPNGKSVLLSTGTANNANTGWQCTGFGQNY